MKQVTIFGRHSRRQALDRTRGFHILHACEGVRLSGVKGRVGEEEGIGAAKKQEEVEISVPGQPCALHQADILCGSRLTIHSVTQSVHVQV